MDKGFLPFLCSSPASSAMRLFFTRMMTTPSGINLYRRQSNQTGFAKLIANAISYTPHGEITIGARDTGRVGEGECFVRDNGAGIQPERLQFVFDKEETDPNKEGGLGLGLAIVKTFVEAHDGVVTLESESGIGSTFRFTLPARRSSELAASYVQTAPFDLSIVMPTRRSNAQYAIATRVPSGFGNSMPRATGVTRGPLHSMVTISGVPCALSSFSL
jgi:hypothetical protein